MIAQKKNRKGKVTTGNSRRGSWVASGKENVDGNAERTKEKKGGIVKERSLPNLIKRNVNVNYEPKMKGYCDVNKKINLEKLLPTINNTKSRSNSKNKSKSNEKIYNFSKERKKSYSNSHSNKTGIASKTSSNNKTNTSHYEIRTIKNSKSASNLKSTSSASANNNSNSNNPHSTVPFHPPLPVSPFTLNNNPSSTTLKRSSTNSKLLRKSTTISHPPRKPLKPIIPKYATSLLSQAGKTEDFSSKENQDSALILSNIFSLQFHIYAVMDGHGTYGHLVSQHIKSQIEQTFTNASTFKTPKQPELTEAKILSILLHKNHALIRKFVTSVHASLLHERFDTNFSGSTCIIVFHILNTLITVNVGDSRAIFIKRVFNMKQGCSVFEAEALSVDHKPENEEERKRIEKMGGSVEQCKEDEQQEESEKIYRVWVKGETFPGIAMSRSIGDFVAKTVGVCCEPEVNVKYIDDSGKVIVVGSDGVFEFLRNEDIANIVKEGYEKGNVNATAKDIVRKATEMWVEKEDGMDDITVVVVFIGENNIIKTANGVTNSNKDK